MTHRPVLTTYHNSTQQWVGKGFLTRSMLLYNTHAAEMNPFLIFVPTRRIFFSRPIGPRALARIRTVASRLLRWLFARRGTAESTSSVGRSARVSCSG